MSSAVPVDDLIPCQGLACSISSLFFDWPECFGFQGRGVCLCVEFDSMCCKFPKQGVTPEGKWFVFNSGTAYIVQPSVFCKSTSQTCCMENRCALPCDKEVPCIVNVMGFTCCFEWACKPACCSKVSAIRGVPSGTAVSYNNSTGGASKPQTVAGTGFTS